MAISQAWLNVLLTTRVVLDAALIVRDRVQALAETPQRLHCGKTAGRRSWLDISTCLGCKSGEAGAGNRQWGYEISYQSGLPAGIGSNDIGLGRGRLARRSLVRFDAAPEVLLIQENLEYRPMINDP